MFRNIACVVALAGLVAGCGVFNGGGPGQTDQTVLFAGDAGVLCAVIPIEAPKETGNARLAVKCAQSVLVAEVVDVKEVVACASKAGVPAQYQTLVGLVADRVVARTGGPVFPKASVGGEAVKAFLATCSVALG